MPAGENGSNLAGPLLSLAHVMEAAGSPLVTSSVNGHGHEGTERVAASEAAAREHIEPLVLNFNDEDPGEPVTHATALAEVPVEEAVDQLTLNAEPVEAAMPDLGKSEEPVLVDSAPAAEAVEEAATAGPVVDTSAEVDAELVVAEPVAEVAEPQAVEEAMAPVAADEPVAEAPTVEELVAAVAEPEVVEEAAASAVEEPVAAVAEPEVVEAATPVVEEPVAAVAEPEVVEAAAPAVEELVAAVAEPEVVEEAATPAVVDEPVAGVAEPEVIENYTAPAVIEEAATEAPVEAVVGSEVTDEVAAEEAVIADAQVVALEPEAIEESVVSEPEPVLNAEGVVEVVSPEESQPIDKEIETEPPTPKTVVDETEPTAVGEASIEPSGDAPEPERVFCLGPVTEAVVVTEPVAEALPLEEVPAEPAETKLEPDSVEESIPDAEVPVQSLVDEVVEETPAADLREAQTTLVSDEPIAVTPQAEAAVGPDLAAAVAEETTVASEAVSSVPMEAVIHEAGEETLVHPSVSQAEPVAEPDGEPAEEPVAATPVEPSIFLDPDSQAADPELSGRPQYTDRSAFAGFGQPTSAQPKYSQYSGASRPPVPSKPETAVAVLRPVVETEASMTVIAEGPRKVTVPGWLISVLTMLTLLAACISVWLYISTTPAKEAAPAPPPAKSSPAGTAIPARSSAPQNALTKYLEVSGLRLAVNSAHKSSVQYLIVNHSAAELSDVKLTVSVRSASGNAQQAPLFVFNTTIPALSAYESRELSTPIDTTVHSLDVPDWTNLRAELTVNQ